MNHPSNSMYPLNRILLGVGESGEEDSEDRDDEVEKVDKVARPTEDNFSDDDLDPVPILY